MSMSIIIGLEIIIGIIQLSFLIGICAFNKRIKYIASGLNKNFFQCSDMWSILGTQLSNLEKDNISCSTHVYPMIEKICSIIENHLVDIDDKPPKSASAKSQESTSKRASSASKIISLITVNGSVKTKDIIDKMHRAGYKPTNVRATLHYMLKRGTIVRDKDHNYSLPPTGVLTKIK